MMKWWIAGLALSAVLSLGVAIALTSPPKLLSIIDRISGGGTGTHRAGTAIPFGSHDQTLDVWVPDAASETPRPVIVFFYGGGWVKGDRNAYAFAGRALASRGFVVVIPDYRKVPQVRFPAFVEDGAQAVRWTRENITRFGGDPGRIALAGHSAGAHTAVTLALDPRWLKAGSDRPLRPLRLLPIRQEALDRRDVALAGPARHAAHRMGARRCAADAAGHVEQGHRRSALQHREPRG